MDQPAAIGGRQAVRSMAKATASIGRASQQLQQVDVLSQGRALVGWGRPRKAAAVRSSFPHRHALWAISTGIGHRPATHTAASPTQRSRVLCLVQIEVVGLVSERIAEQVDSKSAPTPAV